MKLQKIKLLTLSFCLSVAAVMWTGCSSDSDVPNLHFPIEVGERPESITKGWDGNYFVTVMNGNQEGDGVVKIIQGESVSVFASGLSEPKGIAFVNDRLVVTDLQQVIQIDSNGNTSVLAGPEAFQYPPSYLNDVAADADETGVYVTDMGANTKMRGPDGLWPLDSPEAAAMPVEGRVYHISMDGTVSLIVDANPLMTNPNGVGVGNEGQLLIGAFFKGNLLIYKDGELSVLVADQLRGADAVEQGDDGYYYVSSWSQAKVWKISEDGSSVRVLKDGFQSAADFYLENNYERLLLPDMLAGKVYAVSIND